MSVDFGDLTEVREEQPPRGERCQAFDGALPGLEVGFGGRQGRPNHRRPGKSDGRGVTGEEAAVVEMERHLVSGMSGGLYDTEGAASQRYRFAARHAVNLVLGHRQHSSPQALHGVAIDPCGTGQQSIWGDQMRRSTIMNHHRGSRFACQGTGRSGVIEMDVGYQDRGQAAEIEAQCANAAANAGKRRTGSGFDQDETPVLEGYHEHPDRPSEAAVSGIDQKDATEILGLRHGETRCSASTGRDSVPTPATVTSTVSPTASGPTPSGVPVRTRSPGPSVMKELI